MAIGLVMEFEGMGQDRYDAVMVEIGLDSEGAEWPEGIISHCAGPTENGWGVVDFWESREAFDRFLAERLGPAMAKVGGVPQPSPVQLEIYNSHTETPLAVSAF